MTPAELQALIEANEEREKAIWIREAWFASLLLSPHLKKGRQLKIAQLLPECFKEKEKRGPMTAEDRARELEELKKSVGIE